MNNLITKNMNKNKKQKEDLLEAIKNLQRSMEKQEAAISSRESHIKMLKGNLEQDRAELNRLINEALKII